MTYNPDDRRISLATGDRPHAFDPAAEPELFEAVLGRRIGAFIVDLIIVVMITIATYVLLAFAGLLTFGLAWLLFGIAFPAVALGYSALTMGSANSATIGMRLMQLEIRMWYGERLHALIGPFHTLVFYFSVSILTPLVLLVPLFNERKRCLHDYLCGTVVINSAERARLYRR